MCAKKKANFALWLTVWLSFERRQIFLETVQQMLICFCHFSCWSTVTPSRRCFEACSVGVVSKFRFFFLVFLSRRMHFVLAGSSAARLLQHLPETSFRSLWCKSLRILSTLSLAVLRGPSSANKSHCTDALVRQAINKDAKQKLSKDRLLRRSICYRPFLGLCAIYKYTL